MHTKDTKRQHQLRRAYGRPALWAVLAVGGLLIGCDTQATQPDVPLTVARGVVGAPMALYVNTVTDGDDANPGDGVCATAAGSCSLRAAVMEANTTPIADVIHLENKTYLLSLPEPADLGVEGGDLNIHESVHILGPEKQATIEGAPFLPVMVVERARGSRTRVIDVTISNARVCCGTGRGTHTGNYQAGGLTLRHGAKVTLKDSAVEWNWGPRVGRHPKYYEGVGGIYVKGGELGLTRTTIRENTSTGKYAAVWVTHSGKAWINHSSIHDNTCDATLIEDAAVSSINAQRLFINNSTVSQNVCGGVFMYSNSGRFNNVTVADNEGIGILMNGSTAHIYNSVLVRNSTDVLWADGEAHGTMRNTLISQWPLLPEILDFPGVIVDFSPGVGNLWDNGGPTLTHLLHPESQAVDGGHPEWLNSEGAPEWACYPFDQRGYPRFAPCDMGAYELWPG